MIIYHFLHVTRGHGQDPKASPSISMADLERLRDMFPGNPAWEAIDFEEVWCLTAELALALYKAMAEHYAHNDISAESYPTGEMIFGAIVTSDLLSVFNTLLTFFQNDLGFTTDEAIMCVVAEKQRAQVAAIAKKKARRIQDIELVFAGFPVVKTPKESAIRSQLEMKREEYRKRRSRYTQHPELLMRIESGYRDSTYKIVVTDAFLKEGVDEVNLLELVRAQMAKDDDLFDARCFWNACGIITKYIGSPIVDEEVVPAGP